MRNLIVLLFVVPFALSAQVEHGRQLVKTLCSPEFHGRGYVNSGDSIAAEFIAQEFKNAGCSTFKQGLFQPFSFRVNTFPGKMTLSVNGRELKPGVDFIVDPSSGDGDERKQQLIVIPMETALNKTKLNAELSPYRNRKGSDARKLNPGFVFNLVGLTGDTLKKIEQLSTELAGEFLVMQVVGTKFTWSVSEQQYKFPLIQVQNGAFDLSENKFTIDYTIDAVVRNHTARNVIAYAPAKKRSAKYIVFTAHYDHLGRMGQETYFPGGNDNASGTAMLLELARYFVQNPIDVNVVFMAFAGEEAGLIGSHHYVDNPFFALEKILFLTNIDIMGSGEEGVTIVNATLFPREFKTLTEMNKKQNFLAKIASRGPAANSDHYFFTQAGVPAFFMYTMGPNKHYHDVYDTYEELSFAEFGDIFQLLVDFGTCMPR